MSDWITVVETASYLAAAETILSEEERAGIVDLIAKTPDLGDVIPGTGGLRKVRVPLAGRGKRGGGRLITFFHDTGMPVFLIMIYAKGTQTDLTPAQTRAARALTDSIRAEYGRR